MQHLKKHFLIYGFLLLHLFVPLSSLTGVGSSTAESFYPAGLSLVHASESEKSEESEESDASSDALISDDEFLDEEDKNFEESEEVEIDDPLEGLNRAIFWFNDKVDTYLLEPVARGYRYITPKFFRRGVSNFFENLLFPRYLVSDLVQLKFEQAADHTGRFLINSTAGIVGLVDVAKHVGLEKHYEDFGVALGYHGVPPGPYIVIPLLGPSNLRDGFGRIVDSFLNPVNYIYTLDLDSGTEVALVYGLTALDLVNQREELIEAVESAKETSLDYYRFAQSSYYQVRESYIHDGMPPGKSLEDELDHDFDSD